MLLGLRPLAVEVVPEHAEHAVTHRSVDDAPVVVNGLAHLVDQAFQAREGFFRRLLLGGARKADDVDEHDGDDLLGRFEMREASGSASRPIAGWQTEPVSERPSTGSTHGTIVWKARTQTLESPAAHRPTPTSTQGKLRR